MNVQSSARTNILISMMARLLSVAVAILSVPLLLGVLGNQTYGTWVTLTSLIAFIGILDLGFGNSIRNSVSALETAEKSSVQAEFIGFFHLLCGVTLICLVGLVIAVDLTPLTSENRLVAALLYGPVLLLLPLQLGASVLQGVRATGLQSTIQSASVWLFFFYVLLLVMNGMTPTLIQLAIAWSAFYSIGLVATFVLALQTMQIPVHRLFSWSLRVLPMGRMKVGGGFLVLQLTSLVLYSMGNIIIFHELGAGDVARYDVLNKIFQVCLGFYTVLIGVMWSEISKHRVTGDSAAMMRIMRRLAGTSIGFSATCAIGGFFAPTIIDYWTHHRLQVSLFESFSMAVLVSVQSIAYVGAVFMNAFEQIRVQVILCGVSLVLMLPSSLILINQGMGIASVPLASMVLTLIAAIYCNRYAVQLIRSLKAPD